MLFNSYTFLLGFLPAVLVGFHLLAQTGRRRAIVAWLLACSLFFYGWWNPTHLPLLLGSVLFNFTFGRRIRRTGRGAAFAIAVNLCLLGVFKYAGLVARTLSPVVDLPDPQLDLPLAISFFTFQQIAYIVDCLHKREDSDFLDYALFVCFFPQLIAGPIVGHRPFVAQLRTPGWFRVDVARWAPGVALFVVGLFKKLVLADTVSPYADDLFGASTAPGLAEAWNGTLAYSLQIYFDFSGYSDMALGLGWLFGIRLPVNFDAPYRATSIVDFWRRWHITLSAFLRDHLYIPLGGNRKGPARRWLNLFLTMLLGGLWHGASWTFVAWGAMHGAMLAVNHAWWSLVGKGRVPGPIGVALTFVCVAFAWVLFRAEDMARSMRIWRGLVGLGGLGDLAVLRWEVVVGLAICAAAPVSWRWLEDRPTGLRSHEAAFIGFAACASIVHLTRVTPFLYFQF
jgi:alginate O-acetyltransferase complex protein AlgI